MSQFMPQGIPQLPMQGYGMPNQQPMQMPQQAMDANMQRYIADMRQKLDDYERRFAQPPIQQYLQQPMQNQIAPQPQEQSQFALLVVASMDEAQNYPPDITGKKQWFINSETDEIYSKQFNVKTAGLEFHRYGIDDNNIAEEPQNAEGEALEKAPGKNARNNIKALEAKIEGLEQRQKELEERLNAKSDAEPGTAPTEPKPDAADHGNAVRGAKSKPNNRNGIAEKPSISANPTGADSE